MELLVSYSYNSLSPIVTNLCQLIDTTPCHLQLQLPVIYSYNYCQLLLQLPVSYSYSSLSPIVTNLCQLQIQLPVSYSYNSLSFTVPMPCQLQLQLIVSYSCNQLLVVYNHNYFSARVSLSATVTPPYQL